MLIEHKGENKTIKRRLKITQGSINDCFKDIDTFYSNSVFFHGHNYIS